jgi:antitoxin (DNA-binding transcriptional repressor) of toxin-antitoxin stability system
MRTDIAFIRSIGATALIAAALAALWPAPSSAQRAGGIEVIIDRAAIAKVPDRTATIVVGNPLIADVSVQAGGTIVVTGKGYGVTNVVALDRTGRVINEQSVTVKSAADSVIVYRGAMRESYSCAPDCERRITLGDTPDYFDQNLGQIGNRNQAAHLGQSPVGSNGGR